MILFFASSFWPALHRFLRVTTSVQSLFKFYFYFYTLNLVLGETVLAEEGFTYHCDINHVLKIICMFLRMAKFSPLSVFDNKLWLVGCFCWTHFLYSLMLTVNFSYLYFNVNFSICHVFKSYYLSCNVM